MTQSLFTPSYIETCGICGYELCEEDITVAGLSAEGAFLSICRCCLDVPARLLGMVIPSTASPTATRETLDNLESLGHDVGEIRSAMKQNPDRHVLHLFKPTETFGEALQTNSGEGIPEPSSLAS